MYDFPLSRSSLTNMKKCSCKNMIIIEVIIIVTIIITIVIMHVLILPMLTITGVKIKIRLIKKQQ